MSHLPLDARTILEYLNELGYRNISAEQLKEFLKGMQPQSETSKSKHKAKSSIKQQPQTQRAGHPHQQQQQHQNQHATQQPASAVRATSEAQTQSQRRSPIKVIKCKKPLCRFKFYLDVRDHQLTKRIEEQIKALGGNLEFFLTASVTHFITDKTVLPSSVANNSSRPSTPQTPVTPNTPQTPSYLFESNESKNNGSNTPSGNKRARQSRADAILNRVRRKSATAATNEPSASASVTLGIESLRSDSAQPYTIWQSEYALHFFRKVHHELKEYLSSRDRKLTVKGGCTVEPISLKGGFIKIEAIKRNYRPYYQLFRKSSGTEWPKIELSREDGAFRLAPKKTHQQVLEEQEKQRMTRKSRSRSSQNQRPLPAAVQTLKKGDAGAKTGSGHRNSNMGGVGCKQAKESSDKQCGVCEICKIEYDTLTIHLKTKDHEYFARNSQNFIALDSLIHASADVNKFLGDNKKVEIKNELEEMEVEEDDIADVNARDPLAGPDPLIMTRGEEKRRSSGAHKSTPSPTLREKSKRSTKGKHSSEKFQNAKASSSKSPKTPPKCSGPQKKPSSSMLELQHIEKAGNTALTVNTPATRGKTATTVAVISPPIRAMLPPSSLYKVVETPDVCSPARKTREAGEHAVASPSLIVKFKKVRSTELNRLNGEAESFMFPKRRTSSELPTDVDRQTTSENARGSASPTSLDSSSDTMDIDMETTVLQQQQKTTTMSINCGKRAIITGKRRKEQRTAVRQSFPNAPIQPEVQLKRPRKSSVATAPTTIVAASANITLPEATRKSSRTATAIVTAATTSSRLLRAAVEAAKYNSRRTAALQNRKCASPKTTGKAATTAQPEPADATITPMMKMRSRVPVVKMEDRMGDNDINTDESDSDEDKNNDNNQENDNESGYEQDDVEEDDGDGDDDDNDKDYVNRKVDYCKRRQNRTTPTCLNYKKRTSARNQRAEQRELRKAKVKVEYVDESEEEKEAKEVRRGRKLTVTKSAGSNVNECKELSVKLEKKAVAQRFFDYVSSERLNKMKYSFERLPASDLWFRVFSRHDTCAERYFEYYGSTNYRKLPYELGPIPFERTLEGIRCELCNKNKKELKTEPLGAEIREAAVLSYSNEKLKIKEASIAATSEKGTLPVSGNPAVSSSQYTHKHKKLHLLQRYQQEQQALMQRQQSVAVKEESPDEKALAKCGSLSTASKCDSKASSPERERDRERAGSTHSNTSSCASSTATLSKQKYHNKHLSKAAFMNLELPPRKSPREHASTLALVSCIIKQRQDSQSKPNSEIDEPMPSVPTPTLVCKEESSTRSKPASMTLQKCAPSESPAIRSPRHTRSAAVTPVEELRFTTEISENVKRMRRGQNKYDHSPPIILTTSRPRGRQPKSPIGRRPYLQKHRCQTPIMPSVVKRRKRQKCTIPNLATRHHSYSGLHAQGSALPSIRKTGSKKGVLEFEVDSTALKALDAATKHTDVRKLEWEIDKYLDQTGTEYDTEMDMGVLSSAKDTEALDGRAGTQRHTAESTMASTSSKVGRHSATTKLNELRSQAIETNTPPPTDCFSSDFDLCDLFTSNCAGSDDEQIEGKRKGFCLYNSMSLQNYFRKRKTLKSNRTGWPKVQKKKSSARQQHMLEQRIRFLRDIGELAQGVMKVEPEAEVKEDVEEDHTSRRRGSGVMTPPDTDAEENDDGKTVANDEDAEDTELDAGESVPEEDDGETLADSVEEEHEIDADADADEEDEDDGDGEGEGDVEGDCTAEEDGEDDEIVPTKKRTRSAGLRSQSPLEKVVNITPHHGTSANTSTPSTKMLRGLRRTPQLNGSLGSCISPSEKAGDNSDIFTVSSDGLDTDLDVSNSLSHSHHKGDEEHHNHHENCSNHTPKRKFDLSRYASANTTSSTCAAEVATAAVKSLAISQFLKKEVRVTCRRLRAPFRRFRYRR